MSEFTIVAREAAKHLGLKRYFTGEPCIHGHVAERHVINQRCCRCQDIKNAEWRRLNLDHAREYSRSYMGKLRPADPKKLRERGRKWHEQHRDSVNEKVRKDRALNPEKYRAPDRERHERDREKRRKAQRQHYLANADRIKLMARAYAKANPERRKAHEYKRRAIKMKSGGAFTPDDLDRIRKQQKNRCAYYQICGAKNPSHVDHIFPLSRGGTNYASNIQLTCKACNLSKHAKHPIEFSKELGMLL